jgi:hypothetical protein
MGMSDKKTDKKKEAVASPEFTGHVNSIACAKAGAEFRFDVVGKKDVSCSYVLEAGNGAIAALVTAAYMAGKKVTVMDLGASEVRVGAKPKVAKVPKAPKVKAEKPAKRIKGPVLET